jgi:hypothetical protein
MSVICRHNVVATASCGGERGKCHQRGHNRGNNRDERVNLALKPTRIEAAQTPLKLTEGSLGMAPNATKGRVGINQAQTHKYNREDKSRGKRAREAPKMKQVGAAMKHGWSSLSFRKMIKLLFSRAIRVKSRWVNKSLWQQKNWGGLFGDGCCEACEGCFSRDVMGPRTWLFLGMDLP